MDLIARLNRAIDIEYDSKNNDVDALLKLPIEDRIIKGETLSNLKIHLLDSHPKWLFESSNQEGGFKIKEDENILSFTKLIVYCDNNLSKFREGSPVCLHRGQYSIDLNVLEDNDNEIILGTDTDYGYEGYMDKTLQDSSGWQLDNAKVDIRKVVKKSTAILSYNQEKLKLLNGIFEGSILPIISSEQLLKGTKIAEQTKLNLIQQQAFANAYATENYYLIQGPPGTGKTWLLAHLAIQFAKEGKKVLITANTHTAINNALQKASTLSGYPNIIKVGKKFQTDNLNYDGSTAFNVTDFNGSGFNNDSKGIIVGATCYSPFTRKLEFMNWDIVIIDEAGQLSIPLALAAMVKGQKYILIGDHKQLPPIISDKHTDDVFTKSIFE